MFMMASTRCGSISGELSGIRPFFVAQHFKFDYGAILLLQLVAFVNDSFGNARPNLPTLAPPPSNKRAFAAVW